MYCFNKVKVFDHWLSEHVIQEFLKCVLYTKLTLVCPNRNQWSQRRRGTWLTGSTPLVTWSARPRPRTAWGRCLRWPPGRRYRPRDDPRRAAAFCFSASACAVSGGRGGDDPSQEKHPSSVSALSPRLAQLNGALGGGGRKVKPGQREKGKVQCKGKRDM